MPKINRTLERAIDILQLIHDSHVPLTVKEISEQMDMPITSTFDIVHTLLYKNYLEPSDVGAKTYRIGSMAYRIGMSYMKDTNIQEITKPYLHALEQLTNSTVFLAVKDGMKIIYINKIEASGSIKTSATLGTRRELYSTGLGKSMLALYNPEEIRRMYDGYPLQRFTEHTATSLDAVIEESFLTRERGFAIDDQEGDWNVCCAAAVIRTNTDMVYALSVATLRSEENLQKLKEYGKVISAYALEISRKMGFLGENVYEYHE